MHWDQSEHYDDDRFFLTRIILFVFMIVLLPIGLLFRKEGGMVRSWSKSKLKVPVCPACNTHPVETIEVFGNGDFVIGVHKEFAARH